MANTVSIVLVKAGFFIMFCAHRLLPDGSDSEWAKRDYRHIPDANLNN